MFLLISLLTVLNTSVISSGRDIPRWSKESQLGQPLFAISTHHRISLADSTVRLDIVVEVTNDMLLFVRDGDEFIASMELNLSVIRDEVGQVVRKVKHVTKSIPEYELTNSRRDFAVAVFTVEIPPGEYTIKVMLEDKESRRRETVETEVNLTGYFSSDRPLMSDIMLARSSETVLDERIPLHPTVSGVVPDPSSMLYCYFDLLRKDPSEVCRINLLVMDKSGSIKYSDSLSIIGGDRLSSYFMPIRCEDLSFSRYTVTLKAFSGEDTTLRKAGFRINFYGLPWEIGDLDQAIRQLRYIASPEEIKHLTDAFPSRKEQIFIKFWNDNFSCDNEAVNGKMLEYYDRVHFTNMNFGNNRDGWETDRGRVFIIYGEPTEIEKSEMGYDTVQYEIWYYNHLNKRFVFKDEYGLGEYRLTSPTW